MNKTAILAIILAFLGALTARGDDFGAQYSAGVSYKISKKASVGVTGELRTRNNLRTVDRWTLGAEGSYKVCKYLKVSGGYKFLYEDNREKISLDEWGDLDTWRPGYWGSRHRVNVTLTGSYGWNRLTFSLRERWQYTYRPEKTVKRYDFTAEDWEMTTVSGKGKSVLRSRFQAEYNISRSKVDPYANVELFTTRSLEKTRVTVGGEWKITKKNSLGFYYRYERVNHQVSSDPDMHMIGLDYRFKF